MRINSLKIMNYRQYRDLEIDFSHNNSEKDLHIIIAQNGIGKTNILNALEWCLYDDEPHLGNEHEALDKVNIAVVDEAEINGMESVTVSVEVVISNDDKTHLFKRTQKFNIDKDADLDKKLFEFKSELQVIRTDKANPEIVMGEEADLIVNSFFKKDIRRYFFFDGEQLNSYFKRDENDTTGKKIQESIISLSQIEILKKIEARLAQVLREYRVDAGKNSPNVEALNSKVAEKSSQIDEFTTAISKLDASNRDAETQKQEVEDILENYKGIENNIDTFYEMKKKNEVLNLRKEEIMSKLQRFLYDATVSIAFHNAVCKTLDFVNEQHADGNLPPTIDKDFLKKMLDDNMCLICNRNIGDAERDHISKIIDSFNISSTTSNQLSQLRGALKKENKIVENYKSEKERLFRDLRNIEDEITECSNYLDVLDNSLSEYSDDESRDNIFDYLKVQHSKIKDFEKLILTNAEKKGSYKAKVSELESELNELNIKLKEALSSQVALREINKKITVSQRAYSVVSSIISTIVSNVRKQMEESTMEYFKKFIWKKNTYDKLELNENYEMKLFHVTGRSCLGSCSAAERALLALAYTLSLHDLTGQNSLLFIDTPLSRVSDDNRQYFADIISEISSRKQVILAFTPSEYSNEVSQEFEAKLTSKVTLSTDDELTTSKREA